MQGRAHTVQKDVPNARNRANNDVGVAGQRADRKALGEASVKADFGIEAKGNSDNRRCQFIPGDFMKDCNRGFAPKPDMETSFFAPPPKEINFRLSTQYERKIDNGTSFSFMNKKWQLADGEGKTVRLFPKSKIDPYSQGKPGTGIL